MKTLTFFFISALLLNGGIAIAQQQFDSLGMPTPAPNQKASPNSIAPNVSPSADKGSTKAPQATQPETTGSGLGTAQSAGGTLNTGTSTPTDNGVTPGGLTPE